MQTASIQRRSARDLTTWLAFLLIGLFNFLLTALGASTERLRHDLDLSRGLVGLHASCFAVGVVVAGLAGNRLSLRFGRDRVVTGGALGMAAAALLLAGARTPILTLAAAFAMGGAGSLLLVTLPALLSDRHGDDAGPILTEASSLAAFFAALAPSVVGAAVAVGLGWRAALVLGSLALMGMAVVFRQASRRMADPVPVPAPAAVSAAGRLPTRYWQWWATLALAVCVEFSFVFWTADALRTAAAAAPALAAGAVTVFELALALGRIVGAQLLRRTAGLRLLRLGLVIAGLGFALFWWSRSLGPALAGLAVAGLGVAMLYPISLTAAIRVAEGRSDLASARATLASGLAIGVAPFALGLVADVEGVHLAYLVVPLLLLGAWSTSSLAARRGEQDR
jgi:MFS family permease